MRPQRHGRIPLLSDDEALQDGRALGKIRADEAQWAALERLVRRLDDDAIRKWTDGENVKKQWLRGAREMVAALLPAIEQAVDKATAIEEREKQAVEGLRSVAETGGGSGDLAI
jgi:hypothetical protein